LNTGRARARRAAPSAPHVAATSGQALAVAALLLVGDFVPSLLSPLSGAISDRFDRKHVVVVCELVQGAALLVLAVALPPLPVLLLLVAVRAVAGQMFQPASRAVIPALVAEKDLETANSTLGFGTNGAQALGPLVAAALLPLIGVSGILLAPPIAASAPACRRHSPARRSNHPAAATRPARRPHPRVRAVA
jgi:MFS family permease